jgi:hypothetical protein
MKSGDLEILIFRSKEEIDSEARDRLVRDAYDYGYMLTIIDPSNHIWNETDLKNLFIIMNTSKADSKLVKNSEKKVVILQMRGFLEEDMVKVQNIINDALIDYDMNILILDNHITLEKSSTFFNRISKHLGILEDVKRRKKDEGKNKNESGRRKKTE